MIYLESETEMRRVQCSGNSTFLITLPKKWVHKLDLTNGDNMSIVPISDRTLIIRRIGPGVPVTTEDDPFIVQMQGQDPDDVQRTFTGAYLAGNNIFVFQHETNDRTSKETVRAVLTSVTGVEIIDENHDRMVCRDLTSSSTFSFKQGTRRMHMIIKAMMREVPENDSRTMPKLSELEERYADIKRFHFMMNKHFTKLARGSGDNEIPAQLAHGQILLSRYLERIARQSLRVGRYWVNSGPDRYVMAKTYNALSRLLDSAMEAFNRKDFGLSNDLIEKCLGQERLMHSMRLDLNVKDSDEQSALASSFVLDSLDRIRSYIQDIAENSINHMYLEEFRKAGVREYEEVPDDGDS